MGAGVGDGRWIVAVDQVRLEDLTKGVRVRGVLPGGPVTVVAADWHGSDALTLTYTDNSGKPDQQLLYRAHEPKLSPDSPRSAPSFTGDGATFRLVAEAMRIRMAAQFDPMLAVTTSDLQPLPHQIQAVYGELLPRTRPSPHRATRYPPDQRGRVRLVVVARSAPRC